LLVGNVVARFLARSVLIGAVNMNLQYARLLSAGVKWMVLVLVLAMALDHLAIGGGIVHLAFGILFGGIVLALALAVGLGSKEVVSRSLEREARKEPIDGEEPVLARGGRERTRETPGSPPATCNGGGDQKCVFATVSRCTRAPTPATPTRPQ